MATEATKLTAKASALAAARQQVSGVRKLWIRACNNLKDLNAAFGSANQQVLDLRAQLDYAEAQNSGLQGVLDAASARIANLLRQERNLIEFLQASRHHELQLVEQAHKQSKQQLHQAQKQLSHAEAAAEAAKQEASNLAVQLAGAAEQLAQAQETALEAQLETETARQEVASLKAKLAAAADASERCAGTNRLLSERMSGLEAELASVTGAAQHSAAQAAAGVQAQAELAQRLDAALQQVEALKSEMLQCMQAAQLAAAWTRTGCQHSCSPCRQHMRSRQQLCGCARPKQQRPGRLWRMMSGAFLRHRLSWRQHCWRWSVCLVSWRLRIRSLSSSQRTHGSLSLASAQLAPSQQHHSLQRATSQHQQMSSSTAAHPCWPARQHGCAGSGSARLITHQARARAAGTHHTSGMTGQELFSSSRTQQCAAVHAQDQQHAARCSGQHTRH